MDDEACVLHRTPVSRVDKARTAPHAEGRQGTILVGVLESLCGVVNFNVASKAPDEDERDSRDNVSVFDAAVRLWVESDMPSVRICMHRRRYSGPRRFSVVSKGQSAGAER